MLYIHPKIICGGISISRQKITIYLWCQIVKQAEIAINLLRTSRTNPRLSAYAQIIGTFYFNTTPMAPPGRIISHEKPTQRATWRKHGLS